MSLHRLVPFLRLGALLVAALFPAPSQATPARSDLLSFLWDVPNTHFVGAKGREIRPEDLRDKVVAVGFFNTQCSAPCALRMLDLAKVAAALPAETRGRVAILALTGDPAHDTPKALAQFATGMGLAPASPMLLGSDEAAMHHLYQSIGWRQGPTAPDDVPPTIFVFDRIGQSAMRYDASPLDRSRLTRDLMALVAFSHGVGSQPDAAAGTP